MKLEILEEKGKQAAPDQANLVKMFAKLQAGIKFFIREIMGNREAFLFMGSNTHVDMVDASPEEFLGAGTIKKGALNPEDVLFNSPSSMDKYGRDTPPIDARNIDPVALLEELRQEVQRLLAP